MVKCFVFSQGDGFELWGGATIIAWDLAYSTNGWLVIEGNDVGEPYLLQAPLQIGVISKITSLLDLYFKK